MTKVPRGPAASAQTAGDHARTRSQTGEVSCTAPPAPTAQRPDSPGNTPNEPDDVTPGTRGKASRYLAPLRTTLGAGIRTGTPVTAVQPDGQNATADDNVSTTYGKLDGLGLRAADWPLTKATA